MVDLGIEPISFIKSSSMAKYRGASIPNSAKGSHAITPDYLSFRNTWWGQPQPVSYDFIWKAYLNEPIVRACVDITVDAIIGDGYTIEGKNERHVKKVWKAFKNSNFQKYLQDMVSSLVIFGDAYAELIRDDRGFLEYMRPVDSATIRLDYDRNGRTVRYIQRVLHYRVNFYPWEMAHFNVNTIGGRVYGISSLQSVIFTIRAKMSAQDYNTEYFKRPGLPRSIWISKNLSDAQNERIKNTLKKCTPQTDVYLNTSSGEMEHKLIELKNRDMQFVELMNYLRQEIIAAMGVPPVFLGLTSGSESKNSQIQLESWDRRKKKMRLMIQDIINKEILNTENFGFDDVFFKFNDENSRENLKYAQMAQLLSTIPYTTPNQLLDIVGLPDMGDKKVRYDSTDTEIDKPTKDVGDTPLYLLQAEQEKKVTNAAMNNPNAANPKRNQKKQENSENLNSQQANQTRSKSMNLFKADPNQDYPYGAIEVEPEVMDPANRETLRIRMEENMDALARVQFGINRDFVFMDDLFGPKKGQKSKPVDNTKAIFYNGSTQLDEQ